MKIISLDIESNGLLGEPFAVGAVLFDTDTLEMLDQFSGRSPISGDVDEFVQEHVRPVVRLIPRFESGVKLRETFWTWYKHQSEEAVFADVGYPVEANFLRLCQFESGDTWGGPYPLHEVATLLLAAGVDPDVNRLEYVSGIMPKNSEFAVHNPLDDAVVSAYVVAKTLLVLKAEVIEPAPAKPKVKPKVKGG